MTKIGKRLILFNWLVIKSLGIALFAAIVQIQESQLPEKSRCASLLASLRAIEILGVWEVGRGGVTNAKAKMPDFPCDRHPDLN
jgi:hypothetical protein